MTWGSIEDTPLRIMGSSQYRIPDRPPKDKLLDQLAHDISKYKIEKQDTCNKKS